MKEGGAADLDFGVADETAWQVGLSCGVKSVSGFSQNRLLIKTLSTLTSEAISNRQHINIDCLIRDQRMRFTKIGAANTLNDAR